MNKYYLAGTALVLGLVPVVGMNVSALETSGITTEDALITCLTQPAAATCSLGGDIGLNQAVTITNDITLNLGDYEITEGSSFGNANYGLGMLTVRNGASLTINGEGDAGIYATNAYSAIRLTDKEPYYDATKTAKITLNGGTLSGVYYGIVGNGNRHNTEIIINGGVVEGQADGDNLGIFHPQTGTLTINGGKVIGCTGIGMKSGTLNMNGGEIVATGDGNTVSIHNNGINVAGAAIQLESNAGYAGDMVLNFNGGKVSAPNGTVIYEYGDGLETQVSKVNFVKANFIGETVFDLSSELAGSNITEQAVANGSYVVSETASKYVVDKIANVENVKDGDYVVLEKLSELSDDDAARVEALNISNLNIAAVFNIEVLQTSDNGKDNNPGTLTFSFDIDEDEISPADGYTRTWHMIRIHEGVAAEIPVTVDENARTVTFSSSEFSTYVLSYVDTKIPDAPETGMTTKENGSVTSAIVTAFTVMVATVVAGVAAMVKRNKIRR